MKKIFLATLLLLLVSGCSIFSSPAPSSNVSVVRSAVDGSGNIKPADTFEMPEKWANGIVFVEMNERFQKIEDTEGNISPQEVLESRTLKIARISDSSVSAAVAKDQQEATTKIAKESIKGAVAGATGAIAPGGGIEGLGYLIGIIKDLSGDSKDEKTN